MRIRPEEEVRAAYPVPSKIDHILGDLAADVAPHSVVAFCGQLEDETYSHSAITDDFFPLVHRQLIAMSFYYRMRVVSSIGRLFQKVPGIKTIGCDLVNVYNPRSPGFSYIPVCYYLGFEDSVTMYEALCKDKEPEENRKAVVKLRFDNMVKLKVLQSTSLFKRFKELIGSNWTVEDTDAFEQALNEEYIQQVVNCSSLASGFSTVAYAITCEAGLRDLKKEHIVLPGFEGSKDEIINHFESNSIPVSAMRINPGWLQSNMDTPVNADQLNTAESFVKRIMTQIANDLSYILNETPINYQTSSQYGLLHMAFSHKEVDQQTMIGIREGSCQHSEINEYELHPTPLRPILSTPIFNSCPPAKMLFTTKSTKSEDVAF